MLSKYEGSWTVRDEWLVLTTKEVPVGPHHTYLPLKDQSETQFLLHSADADRLVISHTVYPTGKPPLCPFTFRFELRRVPPGRQIAEVLNARMRSVEPPDGSDAASDSVGREE
jgi:hypothetical protein